MSREIKFRGKIVAKKPFDKCSNGDCRIKNGDWITGSLLHFYDRYFIIPYKMGAGNTSEGFYDDTLYCTYWNEAVNPKYMGGA